MDKQGQAEQRNVPNFALDKAREIWFENYGSAIVEKRRYFILGVLLLGAVIAQALALMAIMPLKEVVPYVITRDQVTGVASATEAKSVAYTPGEAELRYFLKEWATGLLTIDRYTMDRDMRKAFFQVRSKAIDQFSEWVNEDDPINAVKADPSLTRTVTVNTVNFIADGSAIVRITTKKRSATNQSSNEEKKLVLNVHYIVVKPKTEKEIFDNPLGLFITHFAITKEI